MLDKLFNMREINKSKPTSSLQDRLKLKEDGSMPEPAEDPSPENSGSKENGEVVEFEEDYSPKRGLTFIFASAGFSVFVLAILAGLGPYLIRKITGAYSQLIPYGYYYLLDFTYAVSTTCLTVLVAVLLYFSWIGDKKLFPDSLLIGLSVSIFSIFIRFFIPYEFIIIRYYTLFYVLFQTLYIQIGYTFNWVGVLVLLTLGTLTGVLGFKLSK